MQPSNYEEEPQSKSATEVAWEVRGHLLHYRSCDPDTEQATRALEQAQEGFTELCQMTKPLLMASLTRKTRSIDMAQEIAQETYLRAWRSLTGFRQEAEVTTWLHTIAFNQLSGYLKREGKYVASDINYDQRSYTQPEDEYMARLIDPLDSDHVLDIASIIKETPLTRSQRIMVIGHHVLDMTHAELAKRLGKTEGAAKVDLSRAMKKLRERLGVQK